MNRAEHPAEAVLREFRRRRVGRVAVAYVAVAYAVAEGAAALLPLWGGPPWGFRAVLGVLALGFPLATVLAWDFDITDRGIERTPEEPAGPTAARPLGRLAWFVILWVLAGLVIRLFV